MAEGCVLALLHRTHLSVLERTSGNASYLNDIEDEADDDADVCAIERSGIVLDTTPPDAKGNDDGTQDEERDVGVEVVPTLFGVGRVGNMEGRRRCVVGGHGLAGRLITNGSQSGER